MLKCHPKTKSRQALYEIIRASSLSIIFVELSFKPVYPTMVVENLKFIENYNSWSQNIDSRYFYSYTATSLPPSPYRPCSP